MATSLTRPLAAPRSFHLRRSRSVPLGSRDLLSACGMPALVLTVALMLAGFLYGRFLEVHRFLWDNPIHDRNAHYLYALKLATEVGDGRVLKLLKDLNESRVWPPLHGVLAAGVLLVGGRDYRLAVLASLAGWVIAVLFAFLTARRTAGRGGTLAGLVAVIFLLSSPAHRAFATDVMLESLGAGLSLAALYYYLLAVQGEAHEGWKGRCLGLALSVLFVEKYNYWLLVVLAVLAAEFTARPGTLLRVFRDWLKKSPPHPQPLSPEGRGEQRTPLSPRGRGVGGEGDWRRWLAAQSRHPLTYALAAVLLLTGIVYVHGDQPFVWGARRISLYPPHNFIHIAYVLVFLRLLPWWWRTGRFRLQRLDGRLRQVILWHVCPLAVWFLLPKHLSYFLWYLSLGNGGPDQHFHLLEGLRRYTIWLIHDYHGDVGSTVAAVALGLIGLLAWRRVQPGGRAVLLLAVLAALLAVLHPNQKGRNLHSWVSAVWITAGVGATVLLYHRDGARWGWLTPFLTWAVVIGLAWTQAPALTGTGHALEGGPHPDRSCILDVTDAYLPELDSSRRTLILTAVPLKPMVQWTYLQRRGSFERLEEHWYGFGAAGEANRQGFAHWLETTDCDTLVYCDQVAPRRWPDAGPECALHAELKSVLQRQRGFQLVKQTEVPAYACRVEVWRRSRSLTRPAKLLRVSAPGG